MPPEKDAHQDIKKLIEQNQELIKQNNKLLKKLHRNSVIELVLRVIWYGLLIGLPFAVYFYFLEPYFEAFGSNYELFRQGLGELPGLKGIENILPGIRE